MSRRLRYRELKLSKPSLRSLTAVELPQGVSERMYDLSAARQMEVSGLQLTLVPPKSLFSAMQANISHALQSLDSWLVITDPGPGRPIARIMHLDTQRPTGEAEAALRKASGRMWVHGKVSRRSTSRLDILLFFSCEDDQRTGSLPELRGWVDMNGKMGFQTNLAPA